MHAPLLSAAVTSASLLSSRCERVDSRRFLKPVRMAKRINALGLSVRSGMASLLSCATKACSFSMVPFERNDMLSACRLTALIKAIFSACEPKER